MELFDKVQVVNLRQCRDKNLYIHDVRPPKIGDIAYIIEIYTIPELAYEVECSDIDGSTVWLSVMFPDEIEVM